MLRSYARQAGATALADAAGPQAAVLAQPLPELGPAQELTGSGDAARLTLFDAVGALLDRASRAAPLAAEEILATAAAAHLGQAVRTGTRCSYTPPDG